MNVKYAITITFAAQCLFAEAAASAVPRYPLVIKILGLLNLLLFTVAVVMGIYCKHKKNVLIKNNADYLYRFVLSDI